MNLLDILFLSVALAMDCFAVSIVNGVVSHQIRWRVIFQMSFLFGAFQAMMPFIGWLGTTYFAHYIEAYDHWIAFGLLAFLGVKMIWEAFDSEEETHVYDFSQWHTLLLLAVATSIDALAVGISFAITGYKTWQSLSLPLFVIGLSSFLFSVLGNLLGVRFGNSIRHRLQPELIGGLILIFIGVKILISHLYA